MFGELFSIFIASYSGQGLGVKILKDLYIFSPIWAPFAFGWFFWEMWKKYTLIYFLKNWETTLLEVKLPQEILKTPLAMELVLIALHQTSGESTFIDRYWLGKRRTWFSLEMVSFGGEVHFFIWTHAPFKNLIENAIYSQYPGVEVHEVPDYANLVKYDKESMIVWGVEWDLAKPDVYPIKTYVDYGLDKESVKEEIKSDPITSLIEFLGSIHPTGQLWIQILIQSHKNDITVPSGRFFTKKTSWVSLAEKEVDKLLRRDPVTKAYLQTTVGTAAPRPQFSKTEGEIVEAIHRSIAKPAFNVGIRSMYIAPPSDFQGMNIVGMLSCLKQFSSVSLNGFKPARWHIIFDYPWQDFLNMRHHTFSRKIIEYYKRRAYFHTPYKQKPSILNVEELATIYHFPGGVLATPTFRKIMSKKAEPPSNLPV
ncbi:MAG: hypothetical protein G01um101448_146 [Parcubacteria group bacterium Gr01-1014_48]|nr:MAG: hypothetical protein Greene041614_101 [Parcubacteria group bacterium Greene0416_14]TSC74419.1 MAG: hypothetical protein G01um101448_146 [Parcubacteria group bacterium Gr01-1014_48]TSD01272.1 MAG: hypothetical protein Greene101415_361 [Parcubacteria group bacterium Greene1014_15]TSD08407.1 MAG: hypothetical protein Greene07144_123 [Parcubacteria group bacterium Greene0714_4]